MPPTCPQCTHILFISPGLQNATIGQNSCGILSSASFWHSKDHSHDGMLSLPHLESDRLANQPSTQKSPSPCLPTVTPPTSFLTAGINPSSTLQDGFMISPEYALISPPSIIRSVLQFSSVTQSCLTLCNPMDCSTPGFPVHHQLPELTQTHVHWVGDAIHLILCRPLLLLPSIFPSIRVFSKESLHQVDKVLEFQHQHQSFQWTLRTDLL